MKVGRPEVDYGILLEKLKPFLEANISLAESCGLANINRKTIYNLMKKYPWIKEEIKEYSNMGRRRVKNIQVKGHVKILSFDDSDKKKIKQQIAKKRYEIEMLQIELEHPKIKTERKQKIGFCTE